MPHWHEHNPWKDDIVYVTLDELLDCIEGIGEYYSDFSTGEREQY